MIVYTDNRTKILISDTPLSSGGEGEVRIVRSTTEDKYKNTCVKLYYKNKRTPELERKVRYLVSNPPRKTKGTEYRICWPIDAVYDDKSDFIGFIMPLSFYKSKTLTVLTTPSISKKAGPEWHDQYDRENGVPSALNRLQLIVNLFKSVSILHDTGKYVIMDFKPDNVLVTSEGKISLIDMDSVQINDASLSFKGSAITPEYIPPEYYGNSGKNASNKIYSTHWDIFSLAAVSYQILFGLHPYAVSPKRASDEDMIDIATNIRQNLFPFGKKGYMVTYAPPHKKFTQLPPEIQSLFIMAFDSNPHLRPACSEWISTIVKETEKAIQALPDKDKTRKTTRKQDKPDSSSRPADNNKPTPPSPLSSPSSPSPAPTRTDRQNTSDTVGQVIMGICGIVIAILLILAFILL